MRGCETCRYNKANEENGWHENECVHPDHTGFQSDWTFSNGCSDWRGRKISRKEDEHCYQPRIRSERIRQLYVIKEETGIPMTVLLDMAIEVFVGYHMS